MKLIFAVIQPTKLDAVREALEHTEVLKMTICDAQGFGQQRGQADTYRGREYESALLRKIGLEITVNDDFVERTLKAVAGAARTGREGTIGDGKVFVFPVEETIQISDGSRGPGAV